MWVEEKITVRATRARVWKLVGDPARHPRFIPGVTLWEREGEKRKGIGARYDIRLRIGSADLGGIVEIVEEEAGWELAWTSVRGIDHRGRWRLRDGAGGTSEVTLRVIYGIPSARRLWLLPSFLAEQVSAPLLRSGLRRALENLRDLCEADALPVEGSPGLAGLAEKLEAASVFADAGLVHPLAPDRMLRLGLLVSRWGITPAAGYALGAIAFAGETAIRDDLGELTFDAVEDGSNAMARALRREGVGQGTTVALLCRNHRAFVLSAIALWKLGANTVLLNTAFAAPQLAEVVRREKVRAIIHDQEFEGLVRGTGRRVKPYRAWQEGEPHEGVPALAELADDEVLEPIEPPERPGRVVILTSGTTGSPQGGRPHDAQQP